ncbi:MAG TPA: hypothetical protein VNT27_17615 [Propionibacteriaceae bacterium]|nr:hypothetical protein [Propionibacteriaceae bacterium]
MAAWMRLAAAAGVAVLAVTGCSYSSQEPGLFPSPRSTSMAPSSTRFPPQQTNPKLPVAGERIWVSGGATAVTTRIAVHAVRRVEGATVLDWSVTPLHADGFHFGDSLPGIEMGLDLPTRGNFEPAVSLLEPDGKQVYRPLIHSSRRLFNHCLCTPVWRLAQNLRIGETRLQQIAFPALPAATKFVDVSMSTSTPFSHVPVSPVGTAPVADRPTDLARGAELPKPLPEHIQFHNPIQSDQVQRISVSRVWRAPGRTTLEWTLSSLTDQSSNPVPEYGPPVAAPRPDGDVFLVNASPASGPVLAVSAADGRKRLTASWVVTERNDVQGYECLCTELGLWSSGLRRAGGSVSLVTNYPELPERTRSVDVDFPGFGMLRNVPITAVEDSARGLGSPQRVKTGLWTYSEEDPPQGWPTAEWPTDTPDPAQLSGYRMVIEPIHSLPGAH